jgi:hypothetical protein
MPTLHIRGVSAKLYAELRRLAQVEGRSLTEQVKYLLADALGRDRRTQAEILAEIQARRSMLAPRRKRRSISTKFLREDRAR